MEDLRSDDLEELLQELEEEDSTQESPAPEVQRLVHVLKTGWLYLDRQAAAEELGQVGASSPSIIRELTAAKKSDTSPEVRRAAERALQAPVHQEFLKRHPNLEEAERVRAKALDPEEVELLLPILQSGSSTLARQEAAVQLGSVETSSPQIVRALITASESDPHPEVRKAATGSLRAPVHKEYLQQHPDVLQPTESALQQVPGKGETGRGRTTPQGKGLIRCLIASAVAGLVVGVLMAVWHFQRYLATREPSGCGTPLLVSLIVGAVVGVGVAAFSGGAVQDRRYRILSIILGGIVSAVIASLLWMPLLVCWIVAIGGP